MLSGTIYMVSVGPADEGQACTDVLISYSDYKSTSDKITLAQGPSVPKSSPSVVLLTDLFSASR